MFCNSSKIKVLLKFFTILSLSAVFYVFYFTEVVTKYANGYTNVVVSNEEIFGEITPPIITVCTIPHSDATILNKYNVTASALSEPSKGEKTILTNFNKTFVDFFREVTFSLNSDFYMYLTIWIYGKSGWVSYKTKLNESNENIIQVKMVLIPFHC